MCSLNKLPALILSLSLLALPLSSYADSDIRIHGGITIDMGNVRLYISDRHLSGHLYTNRYYGHSGYRWGYHQPGHYRSEKYSAGAHFRSYPNRVYSGRYHSHSVEPEHRYYSKHGSQQRRIINRHHRRNENRSFHHQRYYRDW